MSMPSGERPPENAFSKATVDRWQVFGGMAGVAALVLSVVLAVKELMPLSLVASGGMALVGVALILHWARQPRGPLMRKFLVPLLVTVVGAATTGFLVGRGLDSGQQEGGDSSSSSGTPGSSSSGGTSSATDPAEVPGVTAGSTTITSQVKNPNDEPKRYREDRITLNAYYWVDLDALGAINRGVSNGDRTVDWDLAFGSSLTPADGGVRILPGVPTYQDCYGATDSSYFFDHDAIKKGGSFCMKTSDGRMARITVAPLERDESVELDFVVWDAPGA